MLNGSYINLDQRKDRAQHIIENIKTIPFFKNITRMSAIKDDRDGFGCSASHIKCLNSIMKIKNPDKYYLIIEDDISIKNPSEYDLFSTDFEMVKEFDWDVILLGGSFLKVSRKTIPKFEAFHKVVSSGTTVGYIVKFTYIPTLLENFMKGIELYLGTSDYSKYAIDAYWVNLQKEGNWFIHRTVMCSQIHSYSDIEKRVVNYDKCYRKVRLVN
jgi:GR25 family glycosyltransferase involved in LPS biosynthesis